MPAKKDSPHKAHLFRQLSWGEIDPAYLRQLVTMARDEDLSGAGLLQKPQHCGDSTTASLADLQKPAKADLVARQPMTVAGLELLPIIFEVYEHPSPADAVDLQQSDGLRAAAATVLATVQGPVGVLLQAERVLLNFLQRLSGIATLTSRYTEALGDSDTKILDTRKTTPGLRVLEKYAVAMGGGTNHRMGLYDRVLLKDNHLAASGATSGDRLAGAVRKMKAANPHLPIEVEVDAIEQIQPVLDADADIIMLDNFTIEDTQAAIAMIGDKAFTEASGCVTLETVPQLAKLGLDFISSGALIHKAQWCDIGMDWQ